MASVSAPVSLVPRKPKRKPGSSLLLRLKEDEKPTEKKGILLIPQQGIENLFINAMGHMVRDCWASTVLKSLLLKYLQE